MSLLSIGKSLLMRVGDVEKQGKKLKVCWANYVGFGLMAFSGLGPGGIYAGKMKADEIKDIDKKYYDGLKKRGVGELGVFVLIIDNKATMWEVDLDLIKKLRNPTSDSGVRNALSGFLRAFILKYIKGVIKNDAQIVFENKYELKGKGKLMPKHFLLKRTRKSGMDKFL